MKQLGYVPFFTFATLLWLLPGLASAAPCNLSGTGTALGNAAANLAARSWCEMTPAQINFTEKATKIRDVLSACGGPSSVAQYAHNMAFDPSQGVAGKIGWWGGTHGGSYRFILYDVHENKFSVGPEIEGYCPYQGQDPDQTYSPTCTASWEVNPIWQCQNCSAEHAYDGFATDRAGNFYHGNYGGSELIKVTLPSTINHTFSDCGGQNFGTGAMDFWPDYGINGTLVSLCSNGNDEIGLYNFNTRNWSSPFPSITWEGTNGNLHNQVNYNQGSGEIWITGGDRNTKHYKLWLKAGVPTLTQLANAPFYLRFPDLRAVDDPVHSSGKFIAWRHAEDTVGTSNNGWYEYDMGQDTWTSFASLGITSMPPFGKTSNAPGTSILSVSIPKYGITVWLSHLDDEGENVGGMFLYKHTQSSGDQSPPAPPSNLEVQ